MNALEASQRVKRDVRAKGSEVASDATPSTVVIENGFLDTGVRSPSVIAHRGDGALCSFDNACTLLTGPVITQPK